MTAEIIRYQIDEETQPSAYADLLFLYHRRAATLLKGGFCLMCESMQFQFNFEQLFPRPQFYSLEPACD